MNFSMPEFKWWIGVALDRNDPLKLGRHKVRIFGYHSSGASGKIPVSDLFWAGVVQPIISAANSGVGYSPTGIVEGTHVFGFFADGTDCQTPIIMGTLAGIPTNGNEPDANDFKDPKGKYPREMDVSDVNKLAINEHISDTIIQKKKDEKEESVPIAFGGEWSEPETQYNAKYPYNHVYESESGHVREYDDTEGKERISLWHKKGTFYEMHPNGDYVFKVKNKRYVVIEKDDHLYIKGKGNITVDGKFNIKVEGDTNIEVGGNIKMEAKGNIDIKAGGNIKMEAGGNTTQISSGNHKVLASKIDLN